MKRKSRGFTLMEVMVASAITALVVAAAAPALFQVMTGTERNNNRVTALRQVQEAGTWLSRDALQALTLDVPGGNGFPLTLTWGDLFPQDDKGKTIYVSTDHTVIYAVNGNTLQRQDTLVTTIYDDTGQQQGAPTTTSTTTLVAQYLSAIGASWDAGSLVLTVTSQFPVTSGRYRAEETRTYEVRPRPG